MTSRSKTQIKSFFETGDQPTEAQFIDLIDSYVDKSGPLGTIETAASAGTVGVATFTGGAGTISSYASVLSAAGATVTTTAQAINALVSADPLTWYGSQTYKNTVNFEGKTQFSDDGRRTISGGSISILGTYHTVETQSSAATDDLDTISTTGSGLFTILRAESPSRTVVVKHNTGNILTPDGTDITLDETSKLVTLLYDSDVAKWHVLAKPPTSTGGGIINGGYRSNYYYGPASVGNASTTGITVVADRLYAVPFIVGDDETFSGIGFEVKTLSAGNARLGIYTWVDGLPSALVLDAGTVSTGTTGVKEVSISQALIKGVYALAVIFDATPVVYNNDINTFDYGLQNFLAGAIATTGSDPASYESRAYGSLPATYTPSVTGTLNDWPFLFLRKT